MKKYPMTKAGLEKLKEELHWLETIKRPEVDKRIKRARDFCDFNEDSEYEAALEELTTLKRDQAKLKKMIQHAEIIKKETTDYVTLGSTVTIQEFPEGEKEVYTIVGVAESDPFVGKISNESPLAKSLLGNKINDKVLVHTPHGKMVVKILDIQSL
ncbi:transcription elongation factor GreA [Cerasibacillus terrae]|uniref:Transcription elongation factor GreA n=1 Tax=Cerasibacillus terrae TaxID=2498845 RepID=A0A5C8NI49_9BACI|nr:transcription elongation factor GreA [Cerasibacillus terrae]TXL57846.1 transcription elongation factor GreA [Cerasibacillus terrae]